MRSLAILSICYFMVLGAAIPGLSKGSRSIENDKKDLAEVEEGWLHARDAATLDQILATDFVHPVAEGYFLSKQEHIAWFVKHLPPADRKTRFDHLQMRVYGDTGIVNGMVIATDASGKELSRTVFTDVFVYRDGRWRAVNAQENAVR
jgi:uncharacterized protein DUF4440